MAEGLATADGRKIDLDDVDREFAAAMAAPGPEEAEHPAPPKLPADEEAPYGRKLDGTPKRGRGGRPPKPRVTDAAPAGKPGKAPAVLPDFTPALADLTQGLWMAAAATPIPWEPIRVKVRAQAWVLKENQGGVVQGVNILAQHNPVVRAGVEKLTSGGAAWILPAMFALAPFVVQSASIWRAPVTPELEQLAAQTEADWDEAFRAMQAEMAAAVEGQDAGSPAAA